jgi:prenylcysteine oxidase/farnesylcysteine lyase
MILCNYNQGLSQINGLAGLGSFVSAKVSLLSLVGGNHQVIQSALKQAQSNRDQKCSDKTTKKDVVQHVAKRVTTVVGDLNTMELFSEDEDLGSFDIVILAAPMQQSRVNFLVKSLMDGAVLQQMPFVLLENPDDEEIPPDHEGRPRFAPPLPDFARRPYTQVVTTLVSNADLNAQHFGLTTEDLPRGIYTTETGKPLEHNITAIAQVTPDGVYKVFSSDPLSSDFLEELFGKDHKVEIVKVWGGEYGGATPDYQGQGKTMNYLLYDSGIGLKGHLEGSALYYPNAIESSFACMEMSAIGAKSVAKLVAKRLGLLEPLGDGDLAEEL